MPNESLLRQKAVEGYEKYLAGHHGFLARGLYKLQEYGAQSNYQDHLPSFLGIKFPRWIDRMVQNTNELVNIVDVGYGIGIFLLQASEKTEWKDKTHFIGYGSSLHASRPYMGQPATIDRLHAAGIQLVEGNVIDIDVQLSGIDLLVATNVLEHVKYPTWYVIQKMYRTLESGGLGFVDNCKMAGESEDVKRYLKQSGYSFEVNIPHQTISFQKTHPVLELWI